MVSAIFVGHVLPGVFLMLLAFWWIVRLCPFLRQLRYPTYHKYTSATSLRASLHWMSTVTVKSIPIPSFVIVVMALSLVFREMCDTHWHVYKDNMGHLTMYFLFCSVGLVEVVLWIGQVIVRRGVSDLTPILPLALQQVSWAITIGGVGLLFSYHLEGRDPFDVRVHTLLYLTCFYSFACHVAEIFAPRSHLVVLLRIHSYLQVATWFMVLGNVLHNWVDTLSKEGWIIGIPVATKATALFTALVVINLFLMMALIVASYNLAPLTRWVDPREWTSEQPSAVAEKHQELEMNLLESDSEL